MSDPETLKIKRDQSVLVLSIDRPKVNALNLDLVVQLQKAFQLAERESDIRAVLLTGVGNTFSAGQDIFEIQRASGESFCRHLQGTYNPLIMQIRRLPKPVIAAINGSASGAALGLALACDLRIGSENARFIVGFNTIGLVPDSAVSLLLPALIGLGRASEFTFTNAPISATQALEWGLVNEIVPADQIYQRAFALAAQLAAGPVISMGLTKRLFNKAVLPNLEQVLDDESQMQEIASKNEEHAEGVAAFLEKRPPVFKP